MEEDLTMVHSPHEILYSSQKLQKVVKDCVIQIHV